MDLGKKRMDRLTKKAGTAALLLGLYYLMPTAVRAQELSGCPIAKIADQTSWDRDCEVAVQAEHNSAKKAELHFRHAYVLNERQAYEQSLADLNAACALVPHHVRYLHERGYTLNSLGRYREALVDLNEEASLDPKSPGIYSERALARTRLGDWAGALADRDQEVKLLPDSMSALVARAEARIWLGQFGEAQRDLKTAAALPTGGAPADDAEYLERVSKRLAVLMHHSSGEDPGAKCDLAGTNDDFLQPTFIGDCTLAFFSAKTPQDKADALTQRSIAWLSQQSPRDATADREAAVALDPDNPDRHTNLGFAYLEGTIPGRHARNSIAPSAFKRLTRRLRVELPRYSISGRRISLFVTPKNHLRCSRTNSPSGCWAISRRKSTRTRPPRSSGWRLIILAREMTGFWSD
jgi:tetratricopeptide (TPR) repeat protein